MCSKSQQINIVKLRPVSISSDVNKGTVRKKLLPLKGNAHWWFWSCVTIRWLVMADQSERCYRMRAAAPYSSSPRGELNYQKRRYRRVTVYTSAVAATWHVWLCFSHHQECAAPAIPAYSRIGSCDIETLSSHCPSNHLNNLIRLTTIYSKASREDVYLCACVWVCKHAFQKIQNKYLTAGLLVSVFFRQEMTSRAGCLTITQASLNVFT